MLIPSNYCSFTVIVDCYRYLHREVKLFYDGNLTQSIFEQDSESKKLRMKEHVTIHMYSSTAPCGDGREFTARYVYYNNLMILEYLIHCHVLMNPACDRFDSN